jgi:hypothetical protein
MFINDIQGVAVGTSELAEEELAEAREELVNARAENQMLKARLAAIEVQL